MTRLILLAATLAAIALIAGYRYVRPAGDLQAHDLDQDWVDGRLRPLRAGAAV